MTNLSDQCGHCPFRGDFRRCEQANCAIKKSWYVMQLKSDIDKLVSFYDRKSDFNKSVEAMPSIEPGIPVPEKGCGAKDNRSKLKAIAKKMQVGDSVVVPFRDIASLTTHIRNTGHKAVTRAIYAKPERYHPDYPGVLHPVRVWKLPQSSFCKTKSWSANL